MLRAEKNLLYAFDSGVFLATLDLTDDNRSSKETENAVAISVSYSLYIAKSILYLTYRICL